MIFKVEFGKPAFNYLRLQLTGSRTLWRILAEHDLHSGCIFGYFTRGFAIERLSEFSGGLLDREESNAEMVLQTDRCLYHGVKGYLERQERAPRVALGGCTWMVNEQYPPRMFEHWNLTWMADRRTDYDQKSGQKAQLPSAALVDRYTYQPPVQEFAMEGFKAIWESQPFWIRMCLLTACESPLPLHREVDRTYLSRAAKTAECILLNAYDGDAPLVWCKTRELAEEFHKDACQTPSPDVQT